MHFFQPPRNRTRRPPVPTQTVPLPQTAGDGGSKEFICKPAPNKRRLTFHSCRWRPLTLSHLLSLPANEKDQRKVHRRGRTRKDLSYPKSARAGRHHNCRMTGVKSTRSTQSARSINRTETGPRRRRGQVGGHLYLLPSQGHNTPQGRTYSCGVDRTPAQVYSEPLRCTQGRSRQDVRGPDGLTLIHYSGGTGPSDHSPLPPASDRVLPEHNLALRKTPHSGGSGLHTFTSGSLS